MAFDVEVPKSAVPDAFDPKVIGPFAGSRGPAARTRRVALFEGNDEFGRLQPLLGTAEPTVDVAGDTVNGARGSDRVGPCEGRRKASSRPRGSSAWRRGGACRSSGW